MKRPIRVPLCYPCFIFFVLCPYRRPWPHRHHVMTISVIITICNKHTHHLMPDSWYTFGHRQEMKSAHLGQRACPCWVTCLPHVGNVLAPKTTKSIMKWLARKEDSNPAIRTLSLWLITVWILLAILRFVSRKKYNLTLNPTKFCIFATNCLSYHRREDEFY